jgi:hypothetical protein
MYRTRSLSLLASMGFAALVFAASPALAQITLGTAASFGVLGGSTVTNTGSSIIVGNLGVSPGTAVTGFPPGVVTPPGIIHSADAIAAKAQVDLTTAYNALAGTPTLTDLTGQDLGGLTLTPGVYSFSSSAQLTGTLHLNALGNPNAVFIFKIGSTLTTASSSSVVMEGSGSSCTVFWQVGSSATLGTHTSFAGNILALTSITLTTGANVSGRVLARNGAVTLDGNNVTACPPAPLICPSLTLSPPPSPPNLPPGVVGTAYTQTFTASGSPATPYTYTSAPASPVPGPVPGLALSAGGVLSGTPTTVGTFTFTVTATDTNGCFVIQLYIIVIAAAAPSGCPPIVLSPLALPSDLIGTPYSQQVLASGGTAPYTYIVSSGALPNGLLLDGTTGVIAGTPTTAGIFNFTITATDKNSCPGIMPYSIDITNCPVITLSPPVLPNGSVGVFYNLTVSASPAGAYTYSYSGTLPPGLSLNPGTGALTGTLTTAGVFSFIITATAPGPGESVCTGLLGFTVTISPAETAIPALSGRATVMFAALLALLSFAAIRRLT